MDNSLTLEPTDEEAITFQKHLQSDLTEMDRLFGLMANDQKEIDRLAFTTCVTLAEIRAISERTEVLLATLKAV